MSRTREHGYMFGCNMLATYAVAGLLIAGNVLAPPFVTADKQMDTNFDPSLSGKLIGHNLPWEKAGVYFNYDIANCQNTLNTFAALSIPKEKTGKVALGFGKDQVYDHAVEITFDHDTASVVDLTGSSMPHTFRRDVEVEKYMTDDNYEFVAFHTLNDDGSYRTNEIVMSCPDTSN